MGRIMFIGEGEIHTVPCIYIESISIKNAPNKTTYSVGESFDPTGMVIEATYRDGHTEVITDYTITNGDSLTLDRTSVTISYTENGITKTVAQDIAVVKLLSSLAIGDIVTMNVSGSAREFIVVNQGKPSSNYDDSCNGTWLLMKTLYANTKWHSSSNNLYQNSSVHSYLNSTFLGRLDSDIQTAVKQVKIPYVSNNHTGAISSGANGLSTKIFLLSAYEVNITKSYDQWIPSDGAVLSYFKNTAETDSKRIAYLNNSAWYWWLRSPYTYSMDEAMVIDSGGKWQKMGCTDGGWSVRPAMVMPSDTHLNADNFIG